jgi:hypothetical protein
MPRMRAAVDTPRAFAAIRRDISEAPAVRSLRQS